MAKYLNLEERYFLVPPNLASQPPLWDEHRQNPSVRALGIHPFLFVLPLSLLSAPNVYRRRPPPPPLLQTFFVAAAGAQGSFTVPAAICQTGNDLGGTKSVLVVKHYLLSKASLILQISTSTKILLQLNYYMLL